MGYISNFRNSGEEAILIHGTKNGLVALYSHFVDNRKEFTVKDFTSHIKKVHNVDISEKNKGPLPVMSCFGVSNGVYQAFSDELRREVIGYGDGNAISTSGNLKNHFNKETSIIKSVIGDVEKDQPEDLKLTKASIHKFIPHAPKTKTSDLRALWKNKLCIFSMTFCLYNAVCGVSENSCTRWPQLFPGYSVS